jgi:uncharacterized protein YndB with AHSA1/START domain/predicted enzyme related to lactoylglutathione lyase
MKFISNGLVILFLFFNMNTFAQPSLPISSKQICKSKIYNQSPDSLWWRWTTHDGLKTFFGADNKIELVPGGAFEIYFLLNNPVGQRGSETCKVLSYLPNKQLSFSWNAPPNFEHIRNSEHKTWVVVEFKYLAQERTEITVTHLGWPESEEWNAVYDYFDKAWDVVLNGLSKYDTQKINTESATRKVTGIGGLFFKSQNPKELKEWYKKHLGLNTDEYGANFEWRQGDDSSKYGFTQWGLFKQTTKYFEPSSKEFMINYRVENLQDLVIELKNEGVQIVDEMQVVDYGKFIHIMDIEGNKIELWEPIDTEYNKIVGERTK